MLVPRPCLLSRSQNLPFLRPKSAGHPVRAKITPNDHRHRPAFRSAHQGLPLARHDLLGTDTAAQRHCEH